MSTVTYPNGLSLTSDARSPREVETVLQPLTCKMLGIDPATDTAAYAKVRVGWQQEGQPGWTITDDVCILTATEDDRDGSKSYDERNTGSSLENYEQTRTFQRTWRVLFAFYGPNSFRQATFLYSAFQLDWAHEALILANLYHVAAGARPQRVPELKDGQWWERTDLVASFNELVTETITFNAITSAEVFTYTESGQVDHFDATQE